jgi:hypothetical protein
MEARQQDVQGASPAAMVPLQEVSREDTTFQEVRCLWRINNLQELLQVQSLALHLQPRIRSGLQYTIDHRDSNSVIRLVLQPGYSVKGKPGGMVCMAGTVNIQVRIVGSARARRTEH